MHRRLRQSILAIQLDSQATMYDDGDDDVFRFRGQRTGMSARAELACGGTCPSYAYEEYMYRCFMSSPWRLSRVLPRCRMLKRVEGSAVSSAAVIAIPGCQRWPNGERESLPS